MKNFHTLGIILKRIDYGEADRILTVITPENGKLSILAKGSRRSKSKLAGGLELFSVSELTLIDGKSEIKTVISTRLIKHFKNIVGNIDSTMCAYEFLKLIDKKTDDNCDSEYFELLESGLESLDRKENIEQVYVWFACRLLIILGFKINVEKQSNGNKLEENVNYNFDYEEMAFIKSQNGKFKPKHIKLIKLLEKVTKPENLIHISEVEKLSYELKPLFANCLNFRE